MNLDPLFEDSTPEVNDRGNVVKRAWQSMDRYVFDFNLDEGWKQYGTDQDAWYFGVWVNVKEMKTLTYAEGDITLVLCPDIEHLDLELKAMEEFYGPPPWAAAGIDENGNVTYFYDERPKIET